VHLRPANETFHEFVANIVNWTLGERWWRQQRALPPSERHAILRWQVAFAEVTRRPPSAALQTEHGTQFSATPSGPAYALVSLGYDLYCLEGAGRLPEFLVDRLRRNKSFQSARHEVAVAASLVRADFDVRFLDDVEHEKSHCELIAVCRRTGLRFGVEAKSRVRRGVLHERGEFSCDGDTRGFAKLLKDACRQAPVDLPLLIFLDVNLPPTPALPPAQRGWVQDLSSAVEELQRNSDESRADPYALIVATNFAHHFDTPDGVIAPTEIGFFHARRPAIPLADAALLARVVDAVTRYGRLPREV
jgi:hypothetical protein